MSDPRQALADELEHKANGGEERVEVSPGLLRHAALYVRAIPERPAEPLREALMGAVRQWESDANGATLIAAKNLRRCAADVRTALAQQSIRESRDAD